MMKTMSCYHLLMKRWYSMVQSSILGFINTKETISVLKDISTFGSLTAKSADNVFTALVGRCVEEREGVTFIMRIAFWFAIHWLMPIQTQYYGFGHFGFPQCTAVTHENAQASRDYQQVENGIKTCMYPGYPELHMQFSKPVDYHLIPTGIRI